MAKCIRYGLAAVLFAASVGCLALWAWSENEPTIMRRAACDFRKKTLTFQCCDGFGMGGFDRRRLSGTVKPGWYFSKLDLSGQSGGREKFIAKVNEDGIFGTHGDATYFPLWYPALIFSLAGVGVLRFRRQFSIRSTMITVSVVAGLLGMIVAL